MRGAETARRTGTRKTEEEMVDAGLYPAISAAIRHHAGGRGWTYSFKRRQKPAEEW